MTTTKINNYLKPTICSECGGACCLRVAGCCHPSEFKDREALKQALVGGRYCIDSWEGDPREGKDSLPYAYFIRPAGKGKEGELTDYTWGGIGCTFLTDTGCSLEPDNRPMGCRILEPKPKGVGCICHDFGKREAAIAWLDWNIGELITEIQGED